MPVIQASNLGESEQSSKYETAGTFELNLNLFGTIPVKEIDVNVIPKTKVVPMGNLIGAKLCQKYKGMISKNINHMKDLV